MNRTKDLLIKIISAIETGNLQIDLQLSEDIGACFRQEIELALLYYSKEQQLEIKTRTDSLVKDLAENINHPNSYILLLQSMVLCVDLVSETKTWFVNATRWEQVHGISNSEINEVINYIKLTGELDAISSPFVKEYDNFTCPVYFDSMCEMHFVIHKDKKMYFPRNYDADKVIEYYKSIIVEQDIRSPHCYNMNGFNVKEGDVVVDAGVAEGNFSLEVIDIASHIYLIEADDSWIEALNETFKEYGDKVTIIKGYLSDEMNGDYVSIDGLFSGRTINYIKMDIEGYERMSLLGAESVISNSNDIRLAICSYHKKGDEQWIREFLDGMFIENTTSNGYMVPVWDNSAYHECEVRRGVVFGRK